MRALALALFAAVALIGLASVGARLAAIVLGWPARRWPGVAWRRPARLNSRGLGELTALTFTVCRWAWLVASGRSTRVGLRQPESVALLITAPLYINQFPDRRADTTARQAPMGGAALCRRRRAVYTWLTSL